MEHNYRGDVLRTLTGHSDIVYALAFNSNDMLASGSHDKTIKLWKTATEL